jgi:hypothetical protein
MMEHLLTFEYPQPKTLEWHHQRLVVTPVQGIASIYHLAEDYSLIPVHDPVLPVNHDHVRLENNRLILHGNPVEASNIQRYQVSADGSTVVIITAKSPNLEYDNLLPTEERWVISSVEVWDAMQGKRLHRLERVHIRSLTWLSVSPNGQYYLLRGMYQGGEGPGDQRRDFEIYESTTGKDIYRDWGFFDDVPTMPSWAAGSQQVMYWAWSKDLSHPKTKPFIGLFDIVTKQETRLDHPRLTTLYPISLAWNAARQVVAIGDLQGQIHLFRVSTQTPPSDR